jgi:excisionase family DNA binding protein
MEKVKVFYNATEFAEVMGVHRRTVLQWLKRGYIPGAELKIFGGFKVWQIPEDAVSMSTPVMGSAYLMRERSESIAA